MQGAALLAISARARAISEEGQVGIAVLAVSGDTGDAREGVRRILWETDKRTSIDTAREVAKVAPDDDRLFAHPLVVLSARGAFAPLSAEQRGRLALFLRYGGLLYIDGAPDDDAFWSSVDREKAAFGLSISNAPIKPDHVVHKSFYILERIVGRVNTPSVATGGFIDGRLVIIETRCDVLAALARDKIGSWRHDCTPDGERQREQAIRFGVNLIMFATCTDYKADQVHIPFILKKTRR